MVKVSIDMSKDENTFQNRIFAKVVEKQTVNDEEILLCDFTDANYDFDNHRTISKLQAKLEVAINALKYYAKTDWWVNATDEEDVFFANGAFENNGYERAQQALKSIEEIDTND